MGAELPETAVTGNKFINTDELMLYSALKTNTWDAGFDIPKGYMFINDDDGKMYYFNGTEIKGVNSDG